LWSYTTGAAILSSPTVANDVVYIGSYDDKLYAFKAEGCGQSSCPPLWSYTTGAAITSSPAVANGIVYIGSEDHKLYAFHLPIHIPPSVKQHP
jgi:outer membrane protein assembly factor BamB